MRPDDPMPLGGERDGAPGSSRPTDASSPVGDPRILTRGSVEPRILAAWREWLAALATDAEAAIAAAHVYDELPPEGREAWLDALAEDAPKLDVPSVAVYGPLLSVEADPVRRERMEQAMRDRPPAQGPGSETCRLVTALRGIARDGSRVVALIRPLYLRFVQVLSCRYLPDEGFSWVHHDPILRDDDAPSDGAVVQDVVLEATPVKPVVEELAHAILAQCRRGSELPPALRIFADLFDAQLDADTTA